MATSDLYFGNYTPDVSDVNASYSQNVLNVVPRGDGWGPFKSFNAFTAPLPAQCRGQFYARNRDGSISLFGATATNLYLVDNTTLKWTLVSKGSSDYSSVSSDAQWQFAQFNDFVFATHANVVMQVYDLTSSTAFDDNGGSPPQAAYIAIVNRFVVLTGLLSQPYRVQWCDLNDTTNWTAGTGDSDFQDLPDGGVARGVAGGELGFVFQDQSIRRMLFVPGSDVIFQIDRIGKDVGLLAPYSLVNAGPYICWLSAKGFMKMDSQGDFTPIGKERVDRTFQNAFDSGEPQLMIGAPSPETQRIVWAYKSVNFSGSGFDQLLLYDVVLDRWAPIAQQGEYISTMARPGLTLESLDAIAPGAMDITGAADNGSGLIRLTVASTSGWTTGDVKSISAVVGTTEANGDWTITVHSSTTIDLQGSTFTNAYVSGGIVGGSVDGITFSFDDVSTATLPALSIADTTHSFGFFNGPNMEAVLQTSEQSAIARRMFVRGFYVRSDATAAFGNVAVRESQQAVPILIPEQPMDVRGFVPQRADTRFARGRIRIPAGTPWSYASGITPDVAASGYR